MYYYLSIGANIEPVKNIGLCIELLLQRFSALVLFPRVYTCPENINTQNEFINTVVIVETELDSRSLKAVLSDMEQGLGRDRSDPLSSEKDRTCDIDILGAVPSLDTDFVHSVEEPYVREVFRKGAKQATITVFNSTLSNRSTTINLDTRAGNKCVVEQEFNPLQDG